MRGEGVSMEHNTFVMGKAGLTKEVVCHEGSLLKFCLQPHTPDQN